MKLTSIILTAFVASAMGLPMPTCTYGLASPKPPMCQLRANHTPILVLSLKLDKRSEDAGAPIYYAPKDDNNLAPFKHGLIPIKHDDDDGLVPIKAKREGDDDFVPISGKREDDGISPDVSLLTAGEKRYGPDVSLLSVDESVVL